jgi:hypothetical protein
MLNPTLVLIVTVALSAISLIVLGICILKNLFRPVMRSGMQLLVALTCIPVALLLAKVISAALVENVIAILTAESGALAGMIDLQMVQTLFADIPSAQGAIAAFAQALVAPFAFVIIYFLLWIVIGITVGIVARALEKGGVKPFTYKNKAIGAAAGAVCGVVLLVVYLVPLIGLTGIAVDVLDSGVLDEAVEISAEDRQAIDEIVNTPALSVPRTLGSKALFASLTGSRWNGEKFSLTAELDNACTLVSVALPLLDKPVAEYDESDIAIIQEKLPEAFENSSLLRVLGAEAISGISRAWLQGETFLTMEKPEMEGVTAVAVDSALVLFVDTTKDTIVEDIRGLTPLLSAALAVTKLEQGGSFADIADTLASAASTPEIKSLVMSVGVSVVAKELGLYENKKEIGDAYNEGLALLSQTELTEEELRQEIKTLNDKYAVSMTEEEVTALAAALIAHPYTGSSEAEPSLMHPTTEWPMFVSCSWTAAPVVTVSQLDDLKAWLEVVSQKVQESGESLTWLASEEEDIPTALVTVEDLTALTSKEALEDFGEEEMKSLFNAAAQIVDKMSSGEEVKLEETIGVLGEALGSVTSTESGKTLVNTLVTGALQSDTVCESMGITPGQATAIADSIKESGGLENLGETAKDVSNMMNILDRFKDGSFASGNVTPEDFHTLISTMNDSSAALLGSLCTPDMLKKAGLPEESAQGIAHLLKDLLNGLVEARKNWGDEAYQKEADALYRVLQLAIGAKDSNGTTFEERFGMSVEQLIETVQASELLTTVLPDSINALYAENPDALGLSKSLNADDRAQLLEKIEEYKQDADEGGDALLDALARMLG